MTVEIRVFDIADEDAVVALWEEAGLTRPWNDPRADIRRKLTVQPELFHCDTRSSMSCAPWRCMIAATCSARVSSARTVTSAPPRRTASA